MLLYVVNVVQYLRIDGQDRLLLFILHYQSQSYSDKF